MTRRAAVFGQILCTMLLLGQACAASPAQGSKRAQAASHEKTAHARVIASVKTTRLQTAVLRYTALQSLPPAVRNEFHQEDRASAIAAADEAEMRCARGSAPGTPSGADKISPCLGLYHGGVAPSPVKFRFDLALKSIGAPKDIFVGQCPAGSNSTSCNSFIGEANAEQERLADTLNRQRRYPVATLGVALSF